MIRPSLVLFGPNSSGKTSFIQRFLGIGDILPADFGPVTARIVQFTYAPGEQACFRVYDTMEKTSVQCTIELSSFFENQLKPNWEGITGALLPHVQRPTNMNENSAEFHEWAKCFVEMSLPSEVLSLGIDVYDTPGFLSNNREQVLTDNLHKLVKRSKPTLLFLYDNATISDTDKSCFLAMKNALGAMERVSTFFLNTKADCISIANDYLLDDDPENVSLDDFVNVLYEKRQHCYKLLLRRREMASEILGSPPECVDECTFFDICTIPKGFDPWEKYTDLINVATFQRIIKFAVESYSASTLVLAHDILATVNDYFDLVVSTTVRVPSQWCSLRDEAIQWSCQFFDEYDKLLPTLTDELTANILKLFEELKPQIARQAALIVRADDPIDTLLRDNAKSVRDYMRLAIQEQVIKVAANNLIINRRDQIKDLISNHYQQQRGQRKNELLAISQRQVLGEISAEALKQTDAFNSFFHNLLQIPMRLNRFRLSLPTRFGAYRKELYNRFVQAKIMDGDVADVYKLLDAMDAYATLSNEESRKKFADFCLKDMENELIEQKEKFGNNLIAWVKMQREAFNKNIESNYIYIRMHSKHQQILHDLIKKFSGSFATIECQLLAAVELSKRNGVVPILGEELGKGGFYSVYAVQWVPKII